MATTPKSIAEDILEAFKKPLVENKKVNTKKTINSLEVRVREYPNGVTWEVYAGGGYKYIQFGKRANTKLPVRKVGDKFELVKPLKEWKETKGVNIPDFLLARSIARKARAGIDLIGRSEELMERFLGDRIMDLGFEVILLKTKQV